MSELTLEHLSHYLAHKVKVGKNYNQSGWYIEEMDISIIASLFNDSRKKLILRPLSDFMGKVTAGDIKEELNCTMRVVEDIWDLGRRDKTLNEISYETYIIMCKNHIDFNRLIEQDLAIDKKTINN
jgi:hypothetical protein